MNTFEKGSLSEIRFEIVKSMLDEYDGLKGRVIDYLLSKSRGEEKRC